MAQASALALGPDGLPVIVYFDTSNNLKVAKCANAACAAGTTTTALTPGGMPGGFPSVAIGADGFPVIAFYDVIDGDLRVAKCANAACSAGPRSPPWTRQGTSLVCLHCDRGRRPPGHRLL